MKLLTFLGAGKAYETEYVMPDGRTHIAQYFGVALARFYPDTTMQVFVTKKARETHFSPFRQLVEDYVAELEPVDISDGEDESQLWEVFQAVVDHVDRGEHVIFDITHSFRSLTFLSFLAASYLRVVKDIHLQAVLYGNYEARDRSVTPNRAPVINLTPFVGLLDWMIAADHFIRFGDAQDLARQLEATKPNPYQATKDELAAWSSTGISTTIKTLTDVSLALRLIRPPEAMDASERLQTQLGDATQDIGTYARPFTPLSRQVADAYAPLALSRHAQQDIITYLARERRMVRWYLERKQYIQALAVAREWIISWAMVHTKMTDLLDKNLREEIERSFGRVNDQRRRQQGSFDDCTFSTGVMLRSIPQVSQALKLYERLGKTRNDLLHAGKRPNPQPANSMERSINNLCADLGQLKLPMA